MKPGHDAKAFLNISTGPSPIWEALAGTMKLTSVSSSDDAAPDKSPFLCEYNFEMTMPETLSEEVIEAFAAAIRRRQMEEAITAPVLVKPALRV